MITVYSIVFKSKSMRRATQAQLAVEFAFKRVGLKDAPEVTIQRDGHLYQVAVNHTNTAPDTWVLMSMAMDCVMAGFNVK